MSAASAPGAAPARARILSRAAFETRMLLANGEQLLVSLILPSLALVGLTLTSVPDLGPGTRADLAFAGALTFGLLLQHLPTLAGLALLAIGSMGWFMQVGGAQRLLGFGLPLLAQMVPMSCS